MMQHCLPYTHCHTRMQDRLTQRKHCFLSQTNMFFPITLSIHNVFLATYTWRDLSYTHDMSLSFTHDMSLSYTHDMSRGLPAHCIRGFRLQRGLCIPRGLPSVELQRTHAAQSERFAGACVLSTCVWSVPTRFEYVCGCMLMSVCALHSPQCNFYMFSCPHVYVSP